MDQMRPRYDGISQALTKALDDTKAGSWLTEGPACREFEAGIKQITGAKHCFLTPNGTMALMLAGLAKFYYDRKVITVPALTMIATENAFKVIGATTTYADVDERGLIPSYLEDVVSVYLNGRLPGNIGSITDACQAFGSKWARYYVGGAMELVTCFSFSPHKIISTGQGGCITTNNDKLAKQISALRDFGRTSPGSDVYRFGINGKFSDVLAYIGLGQLKNFDKRVEQKCNLIALYQASLKNIPEVKLIPFKEGELPWMMDIYTEDRDALAVYLKMNGIRTRNMYPALADLPMATKLSKTGLFLPSFLDIAPEEIIQVCETIKEYFYEKNRCRVYSGSVGLTPSGPSEVTSESGGAGELSDSGSSEGQGDKKAEGPETPDSPAEGTPGDGGGDKVGK